MLVLLLLVGSSTYVVPDPSTGQRAALCHTDLSIAWCRIEVVPNRHTVVSSGGLVSTVTGAVTGVAGAAAGIAALAEPVPNER